MKELLLNIENSDDNIINDIEYTTNIPKYDWVKGKDDKWSEYELFLDEHEWNHATQSMNIDQKLDYLYKTMENGIKHVFDLKSEKSKKKKLPPNIKKLFNLK